MSDRESISDASPPATSAPTAADHGADAGPQQISPEGLKRLLAAAERHVAGALAGGVDDVHDLRVILRRVRVLCRELARGRQARGDGPAGLEAGATALFRALGGIRDLDILRHELESLTSAGRLSPPPGPELIEWLEREKARLRLGLPDAVAFFRGEVERYHRAAGGRAASEAGRGAAASASRGGPHFGPAAVRRAAKRRLRRPARRLLRAFRRTRHDPTPAQLHRLRIRGKGLRYSAEPLLATSRGVEHDRIHHRLATLENGLKKLQDALGAVQDAAMVLARLDGLGAAGTLSPAAVGPARVAAARELERRRTAFLSDLAGGTYDNLLHEVKKVAAKQGEGTGGESRTAHRVPLESIPGIGPAKARRLAEAGLASSKALKTASVDDLTAVKTIGPHQAKLIKEFVDGSSNGGSAAESEDVDGKHFERAQAVLALSATVSDYSRTLAQDLAQHEEGDSVRAGRQAERLAEQLADLSEHVNEVSAKKLKSLRAELRETEGLLAKVLDLDATSLKMNKLRKALKAHRKAIEVYLG
jgi:CHAD domain-containing protein